MKLYLRYLFALSLFFAGALAQEPLKVGMITTLSTGAGYLGDDIRKGFELALELDGTNSIELIVEDDAQQPDTAVQLAERLIERDGVKIMTGIVFSNVAMAVVPKIVRDGIVYLSPNAGPSALAGKGCHPNYFNVAWQNDNLHEAMGQFVNDEGLESVYILAPNYAAGKDALAGFKRYYQGEIKGEAYTPLEQNDFAVELANIRAANPQGVFFFYPGGLGIAFLKQFAQADLGIPLYGSAFSFDDTLLDAVGEAAIGAFNTSQWSPDLDNAANQRFVEAYKAKYERYPTLYASQGYDTANLLLSALKAVGHDVEDTSALVSALEAANFESVRGKFSFNSNHHPIQDIYVRQAYQDESGNITNKLVGKVFSDHGDAYVGECSF